LIIPCVLLACLAATWWYYIRRLSVGRKFVPTAVAEAGVA
jgi:hypothetical protein